MIEHYTIIAMLSMGEMITNALMPGSSNSMALERFRGYTRSKNIHFAELQRDGLIIATHHKKADKDRGHYGKTASN